MLSQVLQTITLPDAPGSYQFLNAEGVVIYVGKAKNLARRVASYLRETADEKTAKLVREITDLQFTVTRNEVEALLLEAKLIKEHQPKYNVALKGGERYAYIQVTNDAFPRLVTTRKPLRSDRVFGPYTSGEARVEALHLANTLFKLRVCKRLPKRACLLYHLKLCAAPCIGKISVEDYRANIRRAESFLRGDVQPLLERLEQEMRAYAAREQYEMAKVRRDQIRALRHLGVNPVGKPRRAYDQDAVNFVASPSKMVVQIFHISRGVISRRREFSVRRTLGQSDQRLLTDFLIQYYYTEDIPEEIITPIALSEAALVGEYLAKESGRRVAITVPQQGEKMRLLELLAENISVSVKAGDSALLELQEKLRLPRLPRVIECVDISNLGPTNLVGSLVTFCDGHPDKDNYRRFKIRTVRGQSDYDAMREVIERRFRRLLAEKIPLPDLVLVDGGKPQLSAALSVFRQLGVTQPVAGLAKKFEELYTTDTMYPLRLPKTSAALHLMQRIRNEAHRFAIAYQRLLRSKSFLQSGDA
ncbi:MAG: excinuclease ABC subunit UvrC [Patescibacteria group bacterium]|nr:excinuclease ABC subunit UvrC [Patescibacteria group bacterium]